MFFELMDKFRAREASAVETLLVGARQVSLLVVRNPRARRYFLRIRPNGTARVTIPRGGSAVEARRFVEHNKPWLERQYEEIDARPRHPSPLQVGSTVLYRGGQVPIHRDGTGTIRFGAETLPVPPAGTGMPVNLRPAIEGHLRRLAARELPARVADLAGRHGFAVHRVTVRAQRTRWGSCSRHGTISLNWRLVQTPDLVRDYIILHELAHLRQMNHSPRFWREVEKVCPEYQAAERWLNDHRGLLREG